MELIINDDGEIRGMCSKCGNIFPSPLRDNNRREIKHLNDLLLPDIEVISENVRNNDWMEFKLPVSGLTVKKWVAG